MHHCFYFFCTAFIFAIDLIKATNKSQCIIVFISFVLPGRRLYPGRVEHHPHSSSNSLCRKIVAELCPYSTRTTMGSRHFTPNHSDLACFLITFSNGSFRDSVHICNSLAQIEFCILLRLHPFNAKQGCAFMLITETALVTKEDTFAV